MNGYTSRKFILTVIIGLIATVALFTGFLTGGEWITINTLILGIYGGANVLSERNKNGNGSVD